LLLLYQKIVWQIQLHNVFEKLKLKVRMNKRKLDFVNFSSAKKRGTSARVHQQMMVDAALDAAGVPEAARLVPRRKTGFASALNRRGPQSKETGYVDLAATTMAFDTTGTIVLAATIAQGAAVTQRIGKKITLKSMQMRGQTISGTTTAVCDCALILVYDKRPTGALPAITDILVTANPISFNNDANGGRFKILRRWDFKLSGNSSTPATGNEIQDMSNFVKLGNAPCVFKAAATGAIGDIEEGALYMLSVGSQVAGATAGVGTIALRTRFVDN